MAVVPKVPTVDIVSADWLEVEKALELKERELLAKEGVTVAEGHLDGYKYRPKVKVVPKQSWEIQPMPNGFPKCGPYNWQHRDVNFEIGEGIAYVTLNRPDANNALNDSMSQALNDVTFALNQRRDIRIVILRAEGKMFCSGGDQQSFADAQAMSEIDNRRSAVSFMKFLYSFQCVPQFTIALVQGSAMGSGIGLMCVCDTVVTVRNARFQASEVKIGTCPATIAPFLVRKVGPAFAKRMLCTGENVSADMAKASGLVQDVVEDELDFSKVVQTFCDKITMCAPNAAARAKRLVQNVAQRPLSIELMSYTGRELADIRIQEEAVKGMIAVQAKTKPYWAESPIRPLY